MVVCKYEKIAIDKPKTKTKKLAGEFLPNGGDLFIAPPRICVDMYRGYFPLWRKIEDWGWYQDSNTKAVFLHLLLKCNFKETDYKGHRILPGQCVTGRHKLSAVLGLSERQIRTAFSHLKATNEIAIKATSKFSIITLLNYGKYVPDFTKVTSIKSIKRPSNDHQTTTPNNVNNDKNVYKGFSKRKPPLNMDNSVGYSPKGLPDTVKEILNAEGVKHVDTSQKGAVCDT